MRATPPAANFPARTLRVALLPSGMSDGPGQRPYVRPPTSGSVYGSINPVTFPAGSLNKARWTPAISIGGMTTSPPRATALSR